MFQIFYGTSLNSFVSLDVFPFDYYRDDYCFDIHKDYFESLWHKFATLKTHGDVMNYIKKELETNVNIVTKSNTIYFGIDSLASRDNKSESFYSIDKIFPLQKIKFEDTEFYVPNDLDFYIKNELGNYMQWPNGFSLSAHIQARNNHINKMKKIKEL